MTDEITKKSVQNQALCYITCPNGDWKYQAADKMDWHFIRNGEEVTKGNWHTVTPEKGELGTLTNGIWKRDKKEDIVVPILEETITIEQEDTIGYLTKKLAFEEFKVKLIDNLTSETERAFDIFTEELRCRDTLDCVGEYKKFVFASLLFILQQGDICFNKHIKMEKKNDD